MDNSMMLADYLDERKIMLNVEERSFRATLLKMLEKSTEKDVDAIVDKILEREKIMPTALGRGIFLPRVLLQNKSRSEIIIAVNAKGQCYDDYGSITANIVMLFLFSRNSDYATVLAQSLRLLNDDSLCSELLKSKKPKDIMKAIQDWEQE
jgi:mannitol/fructose-specific phosphotransferase system IIA component (Ntr-type)